MDSLIQDVRFALRTHVRQPGFTAIVLLTLAVGIGATSAIFTVVNAVLLQPLPFNDAGRLVRVTADLEGLGTTDVGMSPPELFDYRDSTDLFDGIAGLYPINANLTEVDEPERVEVLLVSPEYFAILGARAALGRVFSMAEDDHPGIAEVVIISDALWARRFGRAPDVLGRTLRIDDDSFRIVGVMPPTFRHPGRTLRGDIDMWAPAGYRSGPFGTPGRRSNFLAGSLARLKPGLTVAQAQQRLDAFAERLRGTYPTDYPAAARWRPRIIPLHTDVVGDVRPALVMLLAAVALVLLIGCANIAGLLLARASSRQRELAVRRALGSGPLRIARLLLTESVVLALAGGGLGLIVAFWGVDALLALTPASLPRTNEVHVGGRVIAFTALASIGTGILFGLAPALQFSRAGIESLKDGRTAASRARQGLRSALVIAEFALATVLVVGAVLLVRSFRAVQQVDPGFDSRGVLTARVWLPRPNDAARGKYLSHPTRLALFEDVLSRLRREPGVELAAVVANLPLDGPQFSGAAVTVDGRPADASGVIPTVQPTFASSDFFATLRIPLVEGRVFGAEDGARAAPVAIVNQEMARRYFAGSAVGQRIKFGGAASTAPWMTVIGVVGNVLNERLEGTPGPILYMPVTQRTNLLFAIVVRTSGEPAALSQAVVRAVRAADPNVPTFAVRTMDDIVATATASRRFSTQLLGGFALLALFLAAVGIYGVMSYLVHQRTREIGIRMALGARPEAVVRMVASRALVLAGAGTIAGTAAALLLAPVLARPSNDLLFSVSATDPVTLGAVAALLLATAIVATALPARRASRVDPVVALRAD